MSAFLLGYDIGSSSIKASLLNIDTGQPAATAISPETEMKIDSPQPGWAEQDPENWWDHVIKATRKLKESISFDPGAVRAIGISYQMHGLVLINRERKVLRPSIIWCDSRAVGIGEKAFMKIGEKKALEHLLNSPGNFTASKLRWVREHEPELFDEADKFMLPGDFIAMKLTGEVNTTRSGLSEGIFWDYRHQNLSELVMETYGIDRSMVPDLVDTFSIQGTLTPGAAESLGLRKGTPLAYRAGDQPNNAFSLNVLKPGEVAATAGTSGVIYGITNTPAYDPRSRVNTFIHVNHRQDTPRYGVLLCVNGTGIMNSWLKHQTGHLSYDEMNELASKVSPGADGLRIFPFGNGAERVLENRDPGAMVAGLNFNRHERAHLLRAAQEGIVFALNYGFDIMKNMDMELDTVRAGMANMFLSPVFRETFVNTTGATLELYQTDGAQGAARAAGAGSGVYENMEEAFSGLKKEKSLEPEPERYQQYQEIYQQWLDMLKTK